MLSLRMEVGLLSLLAQLVKNLLAMQETQVRFLGWEDPLEKEMASHSPILAWRIAWTEEPGKLQSMGLQESDTTEQLKRERERKGPSVSCSPGYSRSWQDSHILPCEGQLRQVACEFVLHLQGQSCCRSISWLHPGSALKSLRMGTLSINSAALGTLGVV